MSIFSKLVEKDCSRIPGVKVPAKTAGFSDDFNSLLFFNISLEPLDPRTLDSCLKVTLSSAGNSYQLSTNLEVIQK